MHDDGLVLESPGLVHPLKVDPDASVVDNVPVYIALRPEKIMEFFISKISLIRFAHAEALESKMIRLASLISSTRIWEM